MATKKQEIALEDLLEMLIVRHGLARVVDVLGDVCDLRADKPHALAIMPKASWQNAAVLLHAISTAMGKLSMR
jgi:hypothetical protein